jgi:predicted Zn-ribbon and HTH transcriptional regulator
LRLRFDESRSPVSEARAMFRKALLELLIDRPRRLTELGQLLDVKPKDVAEHLQHLLRSIKHDGYRAVIEPAECRHCGFEFGKDKLIKPGKCPKCQHTWISEPRIHLEKTDA